MSVIVKKTEFDAKLQISSPEQITAFLDQEQAMIEKMVDKIADTGVDVISCGALTHQARSVDISMRIDTN